MTRHYRLSALAPYILVVGVGAACTRHEQSVTLRVSDGHGDTATYVVPGGEWFHRALNSVQIHVVVGATTAPALGTFDLYLKGAAATSFPVNRQILVGAIGTDTLAGLVSMNGFLDGLD